MVYKVLVPFMTMFQGDAAIRDGKWLHCTEYRIRC